MGILRRNERAMVKSTCEVKLVNRRNMEELMEMWGLKEMLDGMAKANRVRWYGHVIIGVDQAGAAPMGLPLEGAKYVWPPRFFIRHCVERKRVKIKL